MDVKAGDVYIREWDGKVCKVKKIEGHLIFLEVDHEGYYILTNLFGLRTGYMKKDPTEQSHQNLYPLLPAVPWFPDTRAQALPKSTEANPILWIMAILLELK